MQSSVHLGLGGLGADSSEESNSIYTETDLAQSKYDMSMRTYEQQYFNNRNSSLIWKPGDNSGRSSNTQGSLLAPSVGKKHSQARVWDLQKPSTTIGELREEETDQEQSE